MQARDQSRENKEQRVRAFLQTQSLAVISTIHPQTLQPESALIAFAQTPELELIFETQSNTRKYKNLQSNPKVSLVIGWDPIH